MQDVLPKACCKCNLVVSVVKYVTIREFVKSLRVKNKVNNKTSDSCFLPFTANLDVIMYCFTGLHSDLKSD